ncbi:MAG: glutathione peroxidase [Erysipelotrichales bacterium]|nr:glutathione peroxidase [Erysipelotrichales bacterium]
MNIYEYSVKDLSGEMFSLSNYKGKVILIVNTATKCGFTPQYEGLEKLYKEYKDRGFEILDFPCNQFLNQAPGTDEEINNFCTLNYGTTFKRFSKIKVNGKDAEPLYKFLKKESKQPFNKIKWNFTKFLINRNGEIVAHYDPNVKSEGIKKDIEILL